MVYAALNSPHALTSLNTGNSTHPMQYDAKGNLTSGDATGSGRTIAWTSYDLPSVITQGPITRSFAYGWGRHGLGSIISEAGPYDKFFTDPPLKTVPGFQHVGYVIASFNEVRSLAIEFRNAANAKKLPYRALTLNSNSYAFTFIESLGFVAQLQLWQRQE